MDPGKGFLQALCELLLSHDQHFPPCELEVPQSLGGTTKSRKPSMPGPSKHIAHSSTTSESIRQQQPQCSDLLASLLMQKHNTVYICCGSFRFFEGIFETVLSCILQVSIDEKQKFSRTSDKGKLNVHEQTHLGVKPKKTICGLPAQTDATPDVRQPESRKSDSFLPTTAFLLRIFCH